MKGNLPPSVPTAHSPELLITSSTLNLRTLRLLHRRPIPLHHYISLFLNSLKPLQSSSTFLHSLFNDRLLLMQLLLPSLVCPLSCTFMHSFSLYYKHFPNRWFVYPDKESPPIFLHHFLNKVLISCARLGSKTLLYQILTSVGASFYR